MVTSICRELKYFVLCEDGPTALEYAVLISGIILICMAMISAFGTAVGNWFTGAAPTVGGLPTAP